MSPFSVLGIGFQVVASGNLLTAVVPDVKVHTYRRMLKILVPMGKDILIIVHL